MPELPEVQTVVNTLRPLVVGRIVTGFTLGRNDFATPAGFDWSRQLVGNTMLDVSRRAKRIIFMLQTGDRFFAHLGMSGRMSFTDPAASKLPHTHVILHFEHGEVRQSDPRRFGGLHWVGQEPDEATLGPEPLTMRAQVLADRLLRTNRPVKSALLDQTFIAGLGNIYADEALFTARIHPLTRCQFIERPAAGRLSRAIKTTLNKAIAHRGSTLRDYRDAAGNPGDFQRLHRVYDRAGQPCRRCRTPIARVVLGGRSTHYCPLCQAVDR